MIPFIGVQHNTPIVHRTRALHLVKGAGVSNELSLGVSNHLGIAGYSLSFVGMICHAHKRGKQGKACLAPTVTHKLCHSRGLLACDAQRADNIYKRLTV